MRMTQRNFCGTIFLAILLSAFVLSGCPRAKKTPPDETKKETSEAAPAQEKAEEPQKPQKPPRSAGATPAETQAPPRTAPMASEQSEDPIATGSTLLNPAVPKDAERIQTRLVELGLYKGAIDGIWGPGSRAGLKAFKEQNSLRNPEKWDKETQVLLLGGSGQAAQGSGDPDEESISTGEALLNPDNAKEARIIQKRLSELELYKGPIDGIWGKGSRAGLKAFKEQKSLARPDKWDKETQKLLFQK